MTRSPLYYPLNRGADAEGGGVADLQTDVMRFMAILSLCLVAIFALVQSIPLAPAVQESATVDAVQEIAQPEPDPAPQPIKPAPETVIEQATEIKLTRPIPARRFVRNEPVVLQRPKPAAVRQSMRTSAEVAPEAPVTDAEPVEEGFTLRFETDAALTRLVARQVVGLYAMTNETSLRMNIDGDELSFWPASVPGKFHEMDQSTVPDAVLAAYPHKHMADVKWGVTLPADMSRELDGYLASAGGGSLIIAGNGRINLRR